MSIFRYQKITAYTILSLKESTLWFSLFDEYNDPYELWCDFSHKLPDYRTEKNKLIAYLQIVLKLTDNEVQNFFSNDRNTISKAVSADL